MFVAMNGLARKSDGEKLPFSTQTQTYKKCTAMFHGKWRQRYKHRATHSYSNALNSLHFAGQLYVYQICRLILAVSARASDDTCPSPELNGPTEIASQRLADGNERETASNQAHKKVPSGSN